MTRTMYDSVSWEKIPADAQMVAGYQDGDFAWPAAAWAKFAKVNPVRISNYSPGDWAHCGVLDVERGAASVSDIAGFVRNRHAHGWSSVIYTAESNVPAVRAALAAEKLPACLWVADWTGEPHQVADMTGVIAVQYKSTPDYDVSEVFAGWWHPVA
jgi:hypothetical protein